MQKSVFHVISALTALLLVCPGLAQDDPPSSQDSQTPVFRKNVNLVNLFFSVKDKHGALIPGLTQDQFTLLEDGKPQTIKYFSAESNQPLTLGVLIDTSLSMKKMLGDEIEIGGSFLHKVITEKDLAFVISFDIRSELL